MQKRLYSIFIFIFVVFFILSSFDIRSIFTSQRVAKEDIYAFKKAKSVTIADFENERKRNLKNSNNLSIILEKIKNDALFLYLLEDYKLNCSVGKSLEKLRQHYSKNNTKLNNKELEKLISELKNHSEYQKLSQYLMENAIRNILCNGQQTPEIFIKKIQEHVEQEKEVFLVEKSLTQGFKEISEPNVEELNSFFLRKSKIFEVMEKRDISYCIIDVSESRFVISDNELKKRAKDIKKNLSKSRSKIINQIKKQKKEDFINKIYEVRENQIQNHNDIANISKAFNVVTKRLKQVSEEGLSDKLKFQTKYMFQLYENNISQPIFIGNNKILLFKVDKITKRYLPSLNNIKNKVLTEYKKDKMKEKNIRKMQCFVSINKHQIKENPSSFSLLIENDKLGLVRKIGLNRFNENQMIKDISEGVVKSAMYDLQKGDLVVRIDEKKDKVYVVCVSKTIKGKNSIGNISNFREHVKKGLSYSLFREFLYFLEREQETTVNKELIENLYKS